MKIYEVYDKNADPDDIAICHRFTEQGALAEITQQAQKGRDCAYRMIISRCTWGKAYNETWCKNEAIWFSQDFAGPVCDEHHRPDWPSHQRMVRAEEMARIELGQRKAPASHTSLTNFWFQER